LSRPPLAKAARRIAQIEELTANEVEDGGESPDAVELAAWVAASIQEEMDHRFADSATRTRAEAGALRRQLWEERERRTTERRRLVNGAVTLRRQIGAIEDERRGDKATIDELQKAITKVQLEISKDRALRRLIESRSTRPHDQQVVAQLAKRKLARAKGAIHA
jgi:hypothetical protein